MIFDEKGYRKETSYLNMLGPYLVIRSDIDDGFEASVNVTSIEEWKAIHKRRKERSQHHT